MKLTKSKKYIVILCLEIFSIIVIVGLLVWLFSS